MGLPRCEYACISGSAFDKGSTLAQATITMAAMGDLNDLTPKESFHANLFKNPEALFRRTLLRKLTVIIPSLLLMVTWLVSKDPAYAYMGYGLLLYQAIIGIIQAWRGIQTSNRVITKYEGKIQAKPDASL